MKTILMSIHDSWFDKLNTSHLSKLQSNLRGNNLYIYMDKLMNSSS